MILWVYLGKIGFWSANHLWSSVPESDFHDLLNQLINQENAYKVLSIMKNSKYPINSSHYSITANAAIATITIPTTAVVFAFFC